LPPPASDNIQVCQLSTPVTASDTVVFKNVTLWPESGREYEGYLPFQRLK
jgi:hypothetical protein